jgi:hypothetical protein
MDSNFCFLPERRRAASGHFLKDACGEAARLSVESGFGRQGIWSGLKHDVECFSEQAFSTAPGGKKRVEMDGLNPGGTDRCYGAGGEDVATSSLHLTDGVPRCPSRTT